MPAGLWLHGALASNMPSVLHRHGMGASPGFREPGVQVLPWLPCLLVMHFEQVTYPLGSSVWASEKRDHQCLVHRVTGRIRGNNEGKKYELYKIHNTYNCVKYTHTHKYTFWVIYNWECALGTGVTTAPISVVPSPLLLGEESSGNPARRGEDALCSL